MKNLNQYINERLIISKKLKAYQYTCQPKDRDELREIIKEHLAEDKNADLNDIDVSNITDMRELFYKLDPYNIKIDQWNVSNVENMKGMFLYCKNFNCDLSKWNVSKVKDMRSMFYYCDKFEGKGLENWDVSNAENISYMFSDCKNLNCDLSNWDISDDIRIYGAFNYCTTLEKLNKIPSWYKV